MGEAEFWLVSVPGDPQPNDSWEAVIERTGHLSSNHKFNIPELKVGTLDTLVALSDQLQKLDPFVENVVRKMAQYMADILDKEDKERLTENLLVGPSKLPMENFLTRFQWDGAKFPLRQPLPNIVDGISKLVSQIDTDLKQKSQGYNILRQTLQVIERKETGNLMTRSLVDLVKKEDFVLNSEYLQTLLVVVPKVLYKEWEATYEQLTDMVVPRCSQRVSEDAEYGLYTVTLFQKVVDEFKVKAREKKYSLPVNFQAVVMKPNKKAQKKLTDTLNQLYGHLDSRYIESEADSIDMPGLVGLGHQDYHPYVFFKVNLNLLERS